jgi:hypothetical protein
MSCYILVMTKRLESAQLFIPGRTSYITSSPDGAFKLNLTDAEQRFAAIAARNK